MANPLSQIKVVEISVAMAGPFCGMMLGDYGADVIKIERVGHGDDSRAWPPYFHGGMSHYFASANRNKKSVALDLKDLEAVEVVKRLIADADVVIDNYRYGALARAGLDYETLAAKNPRLIYCSISGFGASGPRRDEPANDLFMQAFSGGMSITGEIGGGPVKMGLSVADIGAGMLGTIGILMALESRHQTGRGQRVDTSLLEGQIAMLSYHLTRYFATDLVPGPGGSGSQVGVPYQAFRSATTGSLSPPSTSGCAGFLFGRRQTGMGERSAFRQIRQSSRQPRSPGRHDQRDTCRSSRARVGRAFRSRGSSLYARQPH